MLSFKRLDVYQFSIQFLGSAYEVTASLPRGQAKLGDQFRQASTSIPLNVAEAAGNALPAEAAHHYAIARGSAQNARQFSMLPKTMKLIKGEIEHGDKILVRIVAMLTKLCR
jgi:four helix bundle protein